MLIASLLLTGALQVAPAGQPVGYSSVQPVRISSCTLRPDPTTTTNAFAIRYEGADSAEISFVNQGVEPVSDITIEITQGSLTSMIEDRGLFSSGVQINHRFDARMFPNASAGVNCSVQSVLFADGTSWDAR